MLIVHRVSEIYKTHLTKRKLPKEVKDVIERAGNVIEVGKDRWSGREGLVSPLLYCEDNKRLIDIYDMESRNRRYSWDNESFIDVEKTEDCPF